eukprot:536513-Hanusia_phi.AAC.2
MRVRLDRLVLVPEQMHQRPHDLGLVLLVLVLGASTEGSQEPGGAGSCLCRRHVLEPPQELQQHHAHAILCYRQHDLLGGKRDGLRVVALHHPVAQGRQDRGDLGRQRVSCHSCQGPEGLGVGGGHGGSGELGDEEGQDDLAADGQELPEALEGV